MQVWASGQAGHANVANGLSLLNSSAVTHAAGKAAHMRIKSAVGLAMTNDDNVAVTALFANKLKAPITCCANGGASWCGVVDTPMGAQGVQYREIGRASCRERV